MLDERSHRNVTVQAVAWALVALGVGLRAWQLLAGRSFFVDEAMLFAGIERPWHAIAQPLPYHQTAPLGWLAAVKATTVAAGTSELALRLLPFLFGVGALLLFAAHVRRMPASPRLFALALLTLAAPLVLFGAFMKQYSADVFAGVLVLYALERWRPVPLAMLGLVLPWFSDAAVIVLAAAGAWLLLTRRRAAWPVVLAWGIGLAPAVAFAFARQGNGTGAFMRDYWRAGFVPDSGIPAWLLGRALVLNGGVLGLHWLGLAATATLGTIGATRLWRHDRQTFLLYGLVAAAAFVLAALRLYPLGDTTGFLGGRTALWLAPFLILVLAAGVEGLRRRWLWLPFGAVAASCAVLAGMPFHVDEMRPALEYVAAHERPGDAVYVYYGARHPYRYYAPRYRLTGVMVGGNHRDQPTGYLTELGALAGRPRVWVVLSHDYAGEIDRISRELGSAGREVAGRRYPGASATLYDLRAWRVRS